MARNNKNKNEINKVKISKILLFIVILLILATLTGSGVYNYLKHIEKRDNISEITYIGMFEDGTYYIPKAQKDIRFQIESSDVNSYKLTDASGNEVDSAVIQKDDKNYIQANQDYTEGETYTLEMIDTKFSQAPLQEATKLQFKIESEEKSEYEYADNVKTIDEDLNIQENDDGIILEVGNLEVDENDILITNNNAYKISEIENGIATVTVSEPYEVYDELELHQEQTIDFTNFEVDSEFEEQIELSVEESPIYQFLINECYAADLQETQKITPTSDGLKIEIKLTLKANGTEYLGIKALANHDLTLKFTITLSCDSNIDIEKGSNINFDLSMKENFDFDIELSSTGTVIEGIKDLSDEEYCDTIEDILSRLEGASTDTSSGSVYLGAVTIPTQIPLVSFKVDVFIDRTLDLQVNFKYNQTVEATQNLGFIYNSDDLKPYFIVNSPSSSYDMTVLGKASTEIGIGFDIGVQVLNAEVKIRSEGGFYAELFAAMNVQYNNTDQNLNESYVGKIEAGIYFKNSVVASMDFFFKEVSVQKEINNTRIPVIQIGNSKITTGITTESTTVEIGDSNNVKLPTIVKNIKDLDTGDTETEECNSNNLSFTDADGNVLSLYGSVLKLNSNEDTTINITYTENNRKYRTTITAKKKSTSTGGASSSSSSSSTGNINANNVVGTWKAVDTKNTGISLFDVFGSYLSSQNMLQLNTDGTYKMYIGAILCQTGKYQINGSKINFTNTTVDTTDFPDAQKIAEATVQQENGNIEIIIEVESMDGNVNVVLEKN